MAPSAREFADLAEVLCAGRRSCPEEALARLERHGAVLDPLVAVLVDTVLSDLEVTTGGRA